MCLLKKTVNSITEGLGYSLMIQYKWFAVIVGIRNDIMIVFAYRSQLSDVSFLFKLGLLSSGESFQYLRLLQVFLFIFYCSLKQLLARAV